MSTKGNRRFNFRVEIEIADDTDISDAEIVLSIMDALYDLDQKVDLFSGTAVDQHCNRLVSLNITQIEDLLDP